LLDILEGDLDSGDPKHAIYRIFRLDARGQIVGLQESAAENDAAAMAEANALNHPHGVTVWQLARKVGDISARPK